VRFQVLTTATMKMVVFWVIAPCSLVEVYRRFRGACSIALMMEAASTFETYQTTRRNNPENSHLQPVEMSDPGVIMKCMTNTEHLSKQSLCMGCICILCQYNKEETLYSYRDMPSSDLHCRLFIQAETSV
jgi:hypothetical protein